MTRMFLLICILFLLTAVALAESPYAKADTPLTLFAVNVGKGDALLLNCGSDTYLIDAGLQEHWGELSCALEMLQVSHLTGVILTHTDKDHAGGLLPLATSSIQVDAWYASAHYADIKKESKHPAVEAAALRGEKVTFLKYYFVSVKVEVKRTCGFELCHCSVAVEFVILESTADLTEKLTVLRTYSLKIRLEGIGGEC